MNQHIRPSFQVAIYKVLNQRVIRRTVASYEGKEEKKKHK